MGWTRASARLARAVSPPLIKPKRCGSSGDYYVSNVFRCKKKIKDGMIILLHRAIRKAYFGMQCRVEAFIYLSPFRGPGAFVLVSCWLPASSFVCSFCIFYNYTQYGNLLYGLKKNYLIMLKAPWKGPNWEKKLAVYKCEQCKVYQKFEKKLWEAITSRKPEMMSRFLFSPVIWVGINHK